MIRLVSLLMPAATSSVVGYVYCIMFLSLFTFLCPFEIACLSWLASIFWRLRLFSFSLLGTACLLLQRPFSVRYSFGNQEKHWVISW